MNTMAKSVGAVLAAVLMTASIAQAQTPAAAGCTPQERSNRTLEDHDQANSGVICPPDIDPAMKAPTPKDGNDTSVIPPPGSPGGNPNVQPR